MNEYKAFLGPPFIVLKKYFWNFYLLGPNVGHFNSVGHILTTLHTPKKKFLLPIDSSKVSFFRADLVGRGFRGTRWTPRAPEGPKGPQRAPKWEYEN